MNNTVQQWSDILKGCENIATTYGCKIESHEADTAKLTVIYAAIDGVSSASGSDEILVEQADSTGITIENPEDLTGSKFKGAVFDGKALKSLGWNAAFKEILSLLSEKWQIKGEQLVRKMRDIGIDGAVYPVGECHKRGEEKGKPYSRLKELDIAIRDSFNATEIGEYCQKISGKLDIPFCFKVLRNKGDKEGKWGIFKSEDLNKILVKDCEDLTGSRIVKGTFYETSLVNVSTIKDAFEEILTIFSDKEGVVGENLYNKLKSMKLSGVFPENAKRKRGKTKGNSYKNIKKIGISVGEISAETFGENIKILNEKNNIPFCFEVSWNKGKNAGRKGIFSSEK